MAWVPQVVEEQGNVNCSLGRTREDECKSFAGEGERVIEPGIGAEYARALLERELLRAALGQGDGGSGE